MLRETDNGMLNSKLYFQGLGLTYEDMYTGSDAWQSPPVASADETYKKAL